MHWSAGLLHYGHNHASSTCWRGWEGTYIHECYDNAISKVKLERKKEAKQDEIHTHTHTKQHPTKTKVQKTVGLFTIFLRVNAESLRTSSRVATNVNQNHTPCSSSLCSTIRTEADGSVRTDIKAVDQMALETSVAMCRPPSTELLNNDSKAHLQRYQLQNPMFTWFSHVCSQMREWRSELPGEHRWEVDITGTNYQCLWI